MNNCKLTLGYNGRGYSGSQFQIGKKTIEGELRQALFKIHGETIKPVFSGRTDAGVHAEGQVVSYRVSDKIPLKGLIAGLNSLLPYDIRVWEAEWMPISFNARHSAIEREYVYSFSNGRIPIYLHDFVMPVFFKIDDQLLQDLTNLIIGKHDFKAFRNLGSKEKSSVRTVTHVQVELQNESHFITKQESCLIYQVHISAHSFLYRMVRNLMGAFFEVLKNKQSVENFSEMLNNAERIYPYAAAEARGLSLIKVNYGLGV